MKYSERVTPIAAATSALATLLCCLPIGFAAAAATASVAAVVAQLRPWLLGASVVLVAVGFVQVYWDEGHVLANVMKRDARAPQPKPECCESDGILWDLAAIYPKGARWEATLPPAVVFDGPVVRVTGQMNAALAK